VATHNLSYQNSGLMVYQGGWKGSGQQSAEWQNWGDKGH